jgi:hypothetical protein
VNEEDITAALQEPSPGKGGRRGRANQQGKGGAATPEKQAASELLGHSDSLSARERNKLKRKAKAMERQSSVRLDNRGRVSIGCAGPGRLVGCVTRTCALLIKQQWWHTGGRHSRNGLLSSRLTTQPMSCRWRNCWQSSAPTMAGRPAQAGAPSPRQQQPQQQQSLLQEQQLCCQTSRQLSRTWRR